MTSSTHRLMRHSGLSGTGVSVVALVVLFLAIGCQPATQTPSVEPPDPVAHGEYLVSILGCHDCHTPFAMGPEGPAPDMARMLSGHPESMALPPPPVLGDGPWNWVGAATNTAFAGPWGTTYAINLTPDTTSGLGAWTEDQFVSALKTGKHMGTGRPIMPPMPWPAYMHMTDDDLKAVYAFLRTVQPLENHVPGYVPPAEATQ